MGWKHFAKLGDHISPPFTRKPVTSIENMSAPFEVNSASCLLMVRDFCHTLPLDLKKNGLVYHHVETMLDLFQPFPAILS